MDLEREGDASADPEDDVEARRQRILDLGEAMVEQRNRALENIAGAQAKQKQRYDIKHQGSSYNIGDRVLKCNRRRDTRMGDKLQPRYTGPFVIHEFVSPGVYRLKDGEKILKQVVNAKNLKLFIEQGSPESRSSQPRTPRKSSLSSAYSTPCKGKSTNKASADQATPPPPPPKGKSTNKASADQATPPPPPPKGKSTNKASADQAKPQSPWIPDLNLNLDDRSLLLAVDGWLNDKIIDAVNKLVALEVGGDMSQTTLLSQGQHGFRAKLFEGVQILHDVNHWVATACIGGEVQVADSLRRPLSAHVGKQLRQLYPHKIIKKTDKLKVALVPCPQQSNASDCGVFASAFAVEWIKGSVTKPIMWDESAMRSHLEKCLTGKHLEVFPKIPLKKRGRKEVKMVVMI
jgi:hypothetical protein